VDAGGDVSRVRRGTPLLDAVTDRVSSLTLVGDGRTPIDDVTTRAAHAAFISREKRTRWAAAASKSCLA
jgi:hypothetical protein